MQSYKGNQPIYGFIYKIENNINGKVYIGQTKVGFNKRYKSKGKGIERVYKYLTRSKEQSRYFNKYLLRSIEKYGISNFSVIEELDVAYDKSELDAKEIMYIEQFDSFSNGYNLTKGGEGVIGVTGERNGMYGVQRFGEVNPNSKRIICLNSKVIFNTLKEASEHFSISKSSISHCCSGFYDYVRLENGERTSWMLYDDFLEKTDDEIEERLKEMFKSKKVICINTKRVFNSTMEASKETDVGNSGIYRCCNNERRSAGVLDGERVQWAYYDEYLKNIADNPNYYINKSKVQRVGRGVICVTTKKSFETAKEAGLFYSVDPSGILKCCKGKIRTLGKLQDGTKLSWVYSDN